VWKIWSQASLQLSICLEDASPFTTLLLSQSVIEKGCCESKSTVGWQHYKLASL
jgi:hypothetical protein